MGKLRIGIIMGGGPHEHKRSLESGESVFTHLNRDLYEPTRVTINEKGEWDVSPEALHAGADLAFLALHGLYGEDGTVQDELDQLGVPYTGSRARVSALGMNKFNSLRLLQDAGFAIPATVHVGQPEWHRDPQLVLQRIQWYMHPPFVVKPNRGSGGQDVTLVKTVQNLPGAITKLLGRHKDVVVQPFVVGREIACGVLDYGDAHSAYPLPPIEIIRTESGMRGVLPARFSDSWIKTIQQTARSAHQALGCRSASVVDMMLAEDGTLYILEVNTAPSLSPQGFVPKAAGHFGISLPELTHRIIQSSL